MTNIIGWGHNKFGKNDDQSSEDMIADVVSQAIKHADIDPKEIDNIVVGTFNNGFQKQDFQIKQLDKPQLFLVGELKMWKV